jgi:hypothetical protein
MLTIELPIQFRCEYPLPSRAFGDALQNGSSRRPGAGSSDIINHRESCAEEPGHIPICLLFES